jgi:hypothetical protein
LTAGAGATGGACSLSELLDSERSLLFDDEHAVALRDRLDDLASETENGGLVRRAVADDERPTPVWKPFVLARRVPANPPDFHIKPLAR